VTATNIQKHLAKLFATVRVPSHSHCCYNMPHISHVSSVACRPTTSRTTLSTRAQCATGTTSLQRTSSNNWSKWSAKTFVR
jgi:hypothetical protein